MITATVQLADSQHPWIGLASFTEGEREFFAGRVEEIDELLRLVRRDILTLLYGVSGLGKTSLLQAGLFPALRAEDCLPVPIRLDYLEGAAPLAAQVFGAIIAAADAARVEAPQLRPDETLWEYLHREGSHFWSPHNDLVTPFLAFDQFEELFTLGRETPECAARTAAFISELADLVENRPPAALRDDPLRAKEFSFKPAPLKVLLAMREDYLADLDRIRSHFRALGQNRLRLLPMGERQARQVIALGTPLLALGVEDRILKFVAGNDDDAELTIAPALLSLVLRELNERRLVRGIDAKITPDLLDVEQQKIFEDFYLRTIQDFPVGVRTFIEDKLLTTTGYRDSCALDDALSCPDVTQSILNELVNRRLLAYEDRHHTRRVELTHDVLIPVIKASRDTRLMREALAQAELRERLAREEKERQERELKVARELAEEQKRRAELSEQREKEQKESARKLRRLALAATGAAALAVVLLAASVIMWRAAQEQARIAAFERSAAKATSPRTFQGSPDLQDILVFGTDKYLWLEHAPFGTSAPVRQQVDRSVRAFQAVNENNIFVLGTDEKLWLEHAPFGNLSSRQQVDAKVLALQAVDKNNIFVLGTDGKLWLEHAPFGRVPPSGRQLVDAHVQTFQGIDIQDVLVLGADEKLWLAHAPFGRLPPGRQPVDANVQAFQGMDIQHVLVLGTDEKLWLESAPFGHVPPGRQLVDANVQGFQAINIQHVLVLGTDEKLWLAHPPFGHLPPGRQLVDANVLSPVILKHLIEMYEQTITE